MMFAEIPKAISDLGTLAAAFTAISIATAILWKTPPVKWLRARISESAGSWIKEKFTEAAEVMIDPIKDAQVLMKDDLSEIKRVVHHHLGHNGDTPRLHNRVEKIEATLQIQEQRHNEETTGE